MKTVLLFAFLATAAASWPYYLSDHHETDAKKQQDVNRLLYRVTDPIRDSFSELKAAAKEYSPEGHGASFNDGGEAARKLSNEIADHRVLSKHHWFSLFNTRQREEALMLFDVLINANDWGTFISSAAHYREQMNEGEFVYAFYVAVIHTKITDAIVLPPLYEITPHMFTNSEVIQQAYSSKMRQTAGVFKMSFTGTQKNPEQRVAYFGEDIGLNMHHVTWHMDFPFWWQDSYGYHLDRKGELFFWAHHQLTARFDSERLSNNLDVVDELYWDRPIKEGFAPHTTYKYGGEFPARPDNVDFQDVDGVARIRDMVIMESRIRDAIAHGYVVSKDGSKIDIRNSHGIDVLGDIIESSVYSPNTQYYGALHNLAHIILGRQADPHGKYNLPPGVMEHFETATRDPSFFRLHKYMDNIFKEHADSLPPYTQEELTARGISFDAITVDGELETYFEDFEFDLKNAVDGTEQIEDVPIFAKVSRLNHKPFTFKFTATNNHDYDTAVGVRISMCPRHDYNGILFTFDEGRWHCIEVDKFWQKLTPGENTFSRASADSSATVPDTPSFATLIANADAGISSKVTRSCGIPDRLLLPKGKPEGMEYVLAAALTYDDTNINDYGGTHAQCGVHGEHYPDYRPLGYPLDRQIPDDRVFLEVPNFIKSVVKITHKE